MSNSLLLPNRYKFIREVQGGQGSVLICEDKNLDRKVAIKFYHTDRSRLMDEIQALQTVHSKHVVEVYDLIIEKSGIGIILEFIDGNSLCDIDWAQVQPGKILRTLYQIACGLTDIHAQGVVHRDIKTNNIKIDPEEIVKIFDFGLSRERGKNDHTVGFKGTDGFAAPELYVSGRVQLPQAVDTYAFGITGWYLIARALPKELIKRPPDPLTTALNTQCSFPPEICALIDSCVAYKADNRPSMQSVKETLEKYLVKDKHQATAVHGGQSFVLSSAQKKPLDIKTPVGKLQIQYDGLSFWLREVWGDVYINNRLIIKDEVLPQSCVITLGKSGTARRFITLDIYHPEVVL